MTLGAGLGVAGHLSHLDQAAVETGHLFQAQLSVGLKFETSGLRNLCQLWFLHKFFVKFCEDRATLIVYEVEVIDLVDIRYLRASFLSPLIVG